MSHLLDFFLGEFFWKIFLIIVIARFSRDVLVSIFNDDSKVPEIVSNVLNSCDDDEDDDEEEGGSTLAHILYSILESEDLMDSAKFDLAIRVIHSGKFEWGNVSDALDKIFESDIMASSQQSLADAVIATYPGSSEENSVSGVVHADSSV